MGSGRIKVNERKDKRIKTNGMKKIETYGMKSGSFGKGR
jgi:hypothetical protein